MKNSKLKNVALLLCFLGSTSVMKADPDPNFHIYICWGQSNMEGNATVPDAEKRGVDERFQMIYTADDCPQCERKKGHWYTAIPPLARCFHDSNKGYGPVDNFGRTLVEKLDPAIRVGVVDVSCGGTSIDLFDKVKGPGYLASSADWLKGYAARYGNDPYGRIISMGKLAQEVGVIKGILVHQGENDSGQADWPMRLKAVYEYMLEDLGLNAEDVPLLVGEVRHDGFSSGHNAIIQQVPSVIPTAHVISSEGCESENDVYHFTVKGYKELGKRYAEKMIELLGDNPTKQSDMSVSAFAIRDNEPGEIQISLKVTNEEIQRVDIFADGEKIASDVETYVWENIGEGEHSVWAVGYDQNNQEYTTSKKKITIMEAQKPFNGTPAKIPGIIQAEEFDFGGEGNAYHDMDEQNRNGKTRNEGVDMNETAVGYTQTGEWIEYTVEVEKSGRYEVEAEVASGNNGAAFTLYMDNTLIIPGEDGTPGGFIDVPKTGDWETFTTVKKELYKLTKGVHVLKVEITGDFLDLDFLKFNLLEADEEEETSIQNNQAGNSGLIQDGEYYVYDMQGKFLRQASVKNGQCEQLSKGYFFLMDSLGNSIRFRNK